MQTVFRFIPHRAVRTVYHLIGDLLATVRAPCRVVRHVGDVDGALGTAAKRIDAEYYVPHLAHVPMEPHASVARFSDSGRLEVIAEAGPAAPSAPTRDADDGSVGRALREAVAAA